MRGQHVSVGLARHCPRLPARERGHSGCDPRCLCSRLLSYAPHFKPCGITLPASPPRTGHRHETAGDSGSSEALKCSDLRLTNDIESSEWPLAPPGTQVCRARGSREGDVQVCGDPSPLAILKQVDFSQESIVQSARSKQIIEEKDHLCRDSKCGFSSRISLVFAIGKGEDSVAVRLFRDTLRGKQGERPRENEHGTRTYFNGQLRRR